MAETQEQTAQGDLARLAALVRPWGEAGYAVLDGAWFDDLPGALRAAGLFGDSLFREHADAAIEAAGPWLVGLGEGARALDPLLAIVADAPAAVFWRWPGERAGLHRHLRGLNRALIPAWAADGGIAPPPDGSGRAPEAVLFRHWDPRVLGALLPVLDAGRFARVLGGADEIAFVSPDHGGLGRVPRDPSWPAPPHGMLALESEHVEALSGRRVEASRRRIMAYLREHAPGPTAGMDDAALYAFVRDSEGQARGLGVVTERGQGLFAYMDLVTRGRASRSPEVRAFIASGADTPDRQVRAALEHAAAWLTAGPNAWWRA